MIYTFYSFKGGVGRSMAVANLGECFHARGLRTLIIDWDLEAPGLESFFVSQDGTSSRLSEIRGHKGLMDMLKLHQLKFPDSNVSRQRSTVVSEPRDEDIEGTTSAGGVSQPKISETAVNVPAFLLEGSTRADFSRRASLQRAATLPEFLSQLYEAEAGQDLQRSLPYKLQTSPLRAYLQCIHEPDHARENGLYLISAGARENEDFAKYVSAVQEFDWAEFYAAYEGRHYFDWLTEQLRKVADVVLIDSRTGVTEMGGICTRQMADAVVCFCAPNFQNVDGVLRVVKGLKAAEVTEARSDREIEVLVIPSRIDQFAESQLQGKFYQQFVAQIEKGTALSDIFQGLHEPLWGLQIPYAAAYSYMEQRVLGPDLAPSGNPNAAVTPDPVTQTLIDVYQKIALHMAAVADKDSRLYQYYGTELSTYFPKLRGSVTSQILPQPPDNWVPRSMETQELKRTLLRGASTSTISKIAVCGPAGIGKTALVAALCRDPEIKQAFPDGIAWISFDSFWKKADLHEFLRTTFGVSKRTGEAGLIKELADKPFLLVMDDVWDLRDIQEITRFGGRCTQLIITRNSGVAATFAAHDLLTVGPFTEEQSQILMQSLPQPITFDEEHAALGRALQRLPLGASLMRMAYERAIAQQQTPAQALETIRQAILRHGVIAFDNLRTVDRNLSFSRSMQKTLSSIRPEEKKLLLIFLKAQKGAVLSDMETALLRIFHKLTLGTALNAAEKAQLSLFIRPEARLGSSAGHEAGSAAQAVEELARISMKQLSDLSLIHVDSSVDPDKERGLIQVEELVAEYLISKGELGPTKKDRSKAAQDSDDHQQELKTAGVSSSDDRRNNPKVQRATAILRGETTTLEEMLSLAERLKDSRYFSMARRLFRNARQHPDAAKLSQQRKLRLIQRHALCTYKDPELSAQRFEAALNILQEGDLNDATPSQETLGLAGAICKNRWQLSGQRHDLERSFFYYDAGWQRKEPLEGDYGYTGINAAFVLDLLASTELQDSPETAATRRSEARAIREKIASDLPPISDREHYSWLKLEWWYFATLAEACFGAERYEEARFWLREGLPLDPPDWQLESTARQLARLACAQDSTVEKDFEEQDSDGATEEQDSEAWNTLRVIVGDAVDALRSVEIGKIGLALSGGGFRASLFHIGVLARLAELDVLRHIEVLSCVSGGSIIGAHYYLEVRRLLEGKADSEITRDDYIEIVGRIEKDFLAAVQKNLRTRLFANPGPNLLSLIVPGYTRTRRLGTLYEKHIFSRVENRKSGAFYLEELRINPKDWEGNFNPKIDNWRRSAKIPILLLNATSLNTGHNWQFSVSWMGEPPAANANSVDRNEILRRMYYWEAPARYRKRKLRFGHAVAASSCVPALFDPIELPGLYPGRTVRLVDGGVHDNQGVAGLLEQECSVVLVSDASGQMNSEEYPSSEVSAVPLRSNSILMARVREAEALQLDALRQSSALNGLMFLHLKQDLEAQNVDWIDCDDPYEPLLGSTSKSTVTRYGVPKAIQQHLAGIRTDLDSFTDREAYTLMLSGYRMADKNFRECIPQFSSGEETRREWNFLQIDSLLKSKEGRESEYARFVKMLKIGASRGFKIWKLWPLMGVVGLLALAAGGYGIYQLWSKHPLRIWPVFAGIGVVVAALWLFNFLTRSRKSLTVIITGMLLGTVGWLVALIHLLVFDPLFLLYGSILKTGSSRVIRSFLPLFLTVILIVGATIGYKYFGRSEVLPKDGTAELRRSAEREQAARNYKRAAEFWTQLLASSPSDKNAWATRGQIYSDRAYSYKLAGEWEKSLADLNAALATNPPIREKIRLLNDRANTHVELRQPEAALADYNTVLDLDSGDSIATSNKNWLGPTFKRTQPGTPPIFVFVKFTREPKTLDDVRKDLPAAIIQFSRHTGRGLNVRGWPNAIPQNEARYNDPGSEKLALSIVEALRLGGLDAKDPVFTKSTGNPRVELWLATKSQSPI